MCALALGVSGCAKAATPSVIAMPSDVSEVDGGDDGKDDADAAPSSLDSGQTSMPQSDAGAKDASMPDSGAPDAPCNIAITETFDNEELVDREDESKSWSEEFVGTAFTWQWINGTGAIPNKTESSSLGGYFFVNSYDKKTPYDARLVSPTLAIANCASVSVAFDHYLSAQTQETKGSLQVRLAGGEWQNVKTWDSVSTGTSRYTGHEQMDLTTFVIGKGTTFQLAFRYEDPRGLGIYWQLDDVRISAIAK